MGIADAATTATSDVQIKLGVDDYIAAKPVFEGGSDVIRLEDLTMPGQRRTPVVYTRIARLESRRFLTACRDVVTTCGLARRHVGGLITSCSRIRVSGVG